MIISQKVYRYQLLKNKEKAKDRKYKRSNKTICFENNRIIYI